MFCGPHMLTICSTASCYGSPQIQSLSAVVVIAGLIRRPIRVHVLGDNSARKSFCFVRTCMVACCSYRSAIADCRVRLLVLLRMLACLCQHVVFKNVVCRIWVFVLARPHPPIPFVGALQIINYTLHQTDSSYEAAEVWGDGPMSAHGRDDRCIRARRLPPNNACKLSARGPPRLRGADLWERACLWELRGVGFERPKPWAGPSPMAW